MTYYAAKFRADNSDQKPTPKEKKPKTGLKRSGIKKKPATLIEKLDMVFSRFVRRSCADDNQNAKCYTCDIVMNWKKLQTGHFVSRKHMATRWDLDNVRCQCRDCNEVKGCNLIVYRERLMKEMGTPFTLYLAQKAIISTKFSKPELEEMIQEYTEKLKLL